MNPVFEKIQTKQIQSIYAKAYQLRHFDIPYHYHPEIEIVFIKKGKGKVFVEHSMTNFHMGDLFVFGSNLPHWFVENKSESQHIIDIIVIQFEIDIVENFLKLPEFENIKNLLNNANSGIKFKKLKKSNVHELLEKLFIASGLERFLLLTKALDILQSNQSYEAISSSQQRANNIKIPTRLERVNQYILKNYNSEISLDLASKIANMNKTSFCRFFKKHTRKSFGEYINSMRLDYASKLLIEGSLNISSICYEAGFNSVPYFIKLFKRANGVTPNQYKMENSIKQRN